MSVSMALARSQSPAAMAARYMWASVAHALVLPIATRPSLPLCASACVRRASSPKSIVSVASRRSAPALDQVG